MNVQRNLYLVPLNLLVEAYYFSETIVYTIAKIWTPLRASYETFLFLTKKVVKKLLC